MAKKRRVKNPFWSKNYIQRPSQNRWSYRGWVIEFYNMPGTGTVQAIGYSPEVVEAFTDAYAADPGGQVYYIDYVDEGEFISARADSQMKAAELVSSGIDYNDFLENKAPSEGAADDIHAIFTTSIGAAHEVIRKLGGYDSFVVKDAKRLRSEVARTAEQKFANMESAQRSYQGRRGQRSQTLRDFFNDIQPMGTRLKWIERAIRTAEAERDSPVALDAEQIAELERTHGSSERKELIQSFDQENGLVGNPGHKTRAKAKSKPKSSRATAAGIISKYMRG